MTILRAAAFAALFLWASVPAAVAQDVTLESRDGAISVSGTLLGFDGRFYRVETRFGELTVDGSGVTCSGVGCPSLTDYVAELTISGASGMAAVLMPALIEAFALTGGMDADRATPEGGLLVYTLSDRDRGRVLGRFTLRGTSTDEGFADLLADEADIAMALREISPAEAGLAREAGLGDLTAPNRSVVLALDARVPVVAPTNPVDALTLDDLTGLMTGAVASWSALGGPDAPVGVHVNAVDAGLSHGLRTRLLPDGSAIAPGATLHGDNRALTDAVARDPFGVGLASFAEIGNAKMLGLTGACGYRLEATRRDIKTEDFPLTTPMFLYLPARRLPALGRDFLDFAVSDAAQVVIRRTGFVDQAPEEVPVALQGDRLANAIRAAGTPEAVQVLRSMTAFLADRTRLTLSFRFEAGSARLDAQSRANVQALARALETGAFDGRALRFVGFSDGAGGAAANLAISRARAEAVRDAVLEMAETVDAGRVEIGVAAFGAAMPLACDDSAWGRQVNRRVEVWLD